MSNFITEERKLRSKLAAVKLLNYLAQKRNVGSNEMKVIAPTVPWKQRTHKGWPIDHDTFKEEGTLKDVPIHLIDTAQSSVVPSIVKSKLEGSSKHDNAVPYLIHVPETGRYHLYDGNHRYTEARLLRKPTLKGLVVHADKQPKYEDE